MLYTALPLIEAWRALRGEARSDIRNLGSTVSRITYPFWQDRWVFIKYLISIVLIESNLLPTQTNTDLFIELIDSFVGFLEHVLVAIRKPGPVSKILLLVHVVSLYCDNPLLIEVHLCRGQLRQVKVWLTT